MDLLLSLFRGSPEKQMERLRKKVKEPHGDPSTRINAVQRLLEMETPQALLVVLDRFTINVSPSVQDEQEKSQLLSWIVARGREAAEPLTRFLRRERQLHWPAQALRQILPGREFSRSMQEVLEYHWESPPASSDPTAQLIRLLEDAESQPLIEVVARFLEHEADDVRLAALDYLFERDEEAVRERVLECYCESEDRPRVRGRILEGLAELGWDVRGFRPRIEETLPAGYTLTRDARIKAMHRG